MTGICYGCGKTGEVRWTHSGYDSFRVCVSTSVACIELSFDRLTREGNKRLAALVKAEGEKPPPPLSVIRAEELLAGAYQTEKPFLEAVRAVAKAHGWLGYHVLRSDGSAPGYPDLHLVRGTVSMYRELKRSRKEKPSKAQQEWLAALTAAGQDAKVWSPEDRAEIIETLRGTM